MVRAFFLLALASLCGCTQLYYKAQEKIGNEKRDILVDRIKKGRHEQEEARKQYQTTFEAFQAATGYKGGKTEEVYKKLKSEYDEAADRSKKVADRIASIEHVSNDMFAEWEGELRRMNRGELWNKSNVLLKSTRKRYAELIRKMKAVDARSKPLLRSFEDQVLFIKHNLNSQAISSLKSTIGKMDGEVQALIRDIEVSTKEADAFIASLPAAAE